MFQQMKHLPTEQEEISLGPRIPQSHLILLPIYSADLSRTTRSLRDEGHENVMEPLLISLF